MKTDAHFGQGSSLLVSTPALVLLGGGMLLALRLDNGLMAGLCLFFLLLGLLARWWGVRTIQGVSIRMECLNPRLFPGQETTIRYQVENEKFLPLVWLELSQNGPEKGCLTPDEAFETYFPPYEAKDPHTPFLRQSFSFVGSWQTVQVNSIWKAQHRGLYIIDRLLARSGDGFGLVQEERLLPADQLPVLAVYPRQVEVDLSLFLQPQWDSATGGRGWMEDNTILRGNREYQPGDNWKHINWRMAAREQGTPINLYETIQPRGMRFILDGESFCAAHGADKGLEETLEILSSILVGLSGAGVSCSLTLPKSKRFPAMTLSSGVGGEIDELLLHLAGYDCLALLDPDVEPHPEAPVFLPSCFPSDAVPQTGSTFLITHSGAALPGHLLCRLDPGKLWIFSLEDCEAPQKAGFRALSLRTLKRGGAEG